MSTEFRNAYTFLPRKAPDRQDPFPKARLFGIAPGTEALGHAVYAEGTHSGIIHARITLEQPTVIGNEQTPGRDGQPGTVRQYTFGGKPAIPATSIKGLISFWAEAASMSPYRLVNDATPLTVSAGPGQRKLLSSLADFVPREQRPGSYLSAVDRLFGFVRQEKGGNTNNAGPARPSELTASAGKLRFTRGVLTHRPDQRMEPVVLKELSGPMKNWPATGKVKGRSATPNFYMQPKEGDTSEHIGKADFAAKPNGYEVRGAKAYLHHPAKGVQSQPWRTAKLHEGTNKKLLQTDRQMTVTPLAAGTQFTFSVRFDNLTDEELALLCFALRPSERFRHKIGFGRPLGLGSIRIDLDGMSFINRRERYSTRDLFAPGNPFARGNQLSTGVEDAGGRSGNHRDWLAANDPRALHSILAVGETHDFDDDLEAQRALGATVPVLWVPLPEQKFRLSREPGENAALAEIDSYRWFQRNDDPANRGQRLELPGDGQPLPTLRTGWEPSGQPPRMEAQVERISGYTGQIDPLKREGDSWRFITMADGTEIGIPKAKVETFGAKGGLNPGDRVRFDYAPAPNGRFLVTHIEKL